MSVGLSSDLNWTEVGRKEIKSQDLGLCGLRAERDRPSNRDSSRSSSSSSSRRFPQGQQTCDYFPEHIQLDGGIVKVTVTVMPRPRRSSSRDIIVVVRWMVCHVLMYGLCCSCLCPGNNTHLDEEVGRVGWGRVVSSGTLYRIPVMCGLL